MEEGEKMRFKLIGLIAVLAFVSENAILAKNVDHLPALSTMFSANPTDQLMKAVKNNNVSEVKSLIKQNININYKDVSGDTALIKASTSGYKNIAEALIKSKKADVNIKNKTGKTALTVAVMNDHKDIVKLLLKNKADANIKDDRGWTPLMYAANSTKSNHKEIVKLLLDNKADPNVQNENKKTALVIAVERGDIEVVKKLLNSSLLKKVLKKTRANIDIPDNKNWTALMVSVAQENIDLTKLLLKNKANPDLKNGEGQTALMIAASKGRSDIVTLLTKKKADVRATDNKKRTVLMYAASHERIDQKTIELLLKKGSDIHAKDVFGQTALDYAQNAGRVAIVNLLIKKGASVKGKVSISVQ